MSLGHCSVGCLPKPAWTAPQKAVTLDSPLLRGFSGLSSPLSSDGGNVSWCWQKQELSPLVFIFFLHVDCTSFTLKAAFHLCLLAEYHM